MKLTSQAIPYTCTYPLGFLLFNLVSNLIKSKNKIKFTSIKRNYPSNI